MAVSEYKQVCVSINGLVYDNIFDGVEAYLKNGGNSDLLMTFIQKRRQNVETWVNQAKKAITSNWVRYVKDTMAMDDTVHGAYEFFDKYGSTDVLPFNPYYRMDYDNMYGVSAAADKEYITVKFLSSAR
jgi:hypothetical protein